MKKLLFVMILVLLSNPMVTLASEAVFYPNTGMVNIPQLIIDGDPSGAVYSVDLQQRANTITFDVVGVTQIIDPVEDGFQVVSDNQSSFLSAVTKSANKYVAVGSDGMIVVSENGTQWQKQPIPFGWDLESIAWSPTLNIFVAVGGWYGDILVSSDGMTWQSYQAPVQAFLRSVVWSNGQFIATGMGVILTSTDGRNWQKSNLATDKEISDVVQIGTRLIAIGGSNGTICFTSTDGRNWQKINNLPYTGMIFGVAWSGEKIVAVGWGGTVMTSDDGLIWKLVNSGVYNNLYDVKWDGTKFIAVGNLGTIITSCDGISWQQQESITDDILSGIFVGEKTVIVGGTIDHGTIIVNN